MALVPRIPILPENMNLVNAQTFPIRKATPAMAETADRQSRLLRTQSDPNILNRLSMTVSPPSGTTAKLSKPPKVHVKVQHKRSVRNRLQRRRKSHANHLKSPSLYILQYESYPYAVEEAKILGIFTDINKASLAATTCGAFAFSREGLNDGMEYLTPTGRIRIVMQEAPILPLRRHPTAPEDLGFASTAMDKIIALRNFTQPSIRSRPERREREQRVYLAMHRAPEATMCIGLFADKAKAWYAALKQYGIVSWEAEVQEEMRWMDETSLPHIKAKIAGSGRHFWSVEVFKINEVVRRIHLEEPVAPALTTVRDV
ncbi:hypothetical protein BDV96DRAFT_641738 [Lophiotrema nucula]|uniref:Uncharacterized protein n=1 Tax=Lophiotrema nucula TaxID=690887 RepID=A0A6A5ZL31_9PLEO|nr:hypothetical protein BDV96DRAFT_641738 [Lophiotrema nucula]